MSKGKRHSDQRSEVRQSDLLRSKVIPNLIALKTKIDQRRPDAYQIQQLGRLLDQPLQSIIIGPRVNQRPLRPQKSIIQTYRDAFISGTNQLKRENDRYKTVCEERAERREKLFSMGIAGSGRRLSPGQGGSYNRTKESNVVCRTRRS